MKKRLLLLLIIPLVASCGHKNSGSNEQSSNEESSIISESSESTSIISSEYSESSISSEESGSSESSSDSSSSEEPVIPEEELSIYSVSEAQEIAPVDFNQLNMIPKSMVNVILENCVSGVDAYNYIEQNVVDAEMLSDERIVGNYVDCFENFVEAKSALGSYYFDNLSYKVEVTSSLLCERGPDSSYYNAHKELTYASYTKPDASNNTTFSSLNMCNEYIGDFTPYCEYREGSDTLTEGMIVDTMYYPFFEAGEYTAFSISNYVSFDEEGFFGEKDGQYYIGNYLEETYEDKYSYFFPPIKMHSVSYTYVVFDRVDENNFVISSSHSFLRVQALSNIFGEELDEPVTFIVRTDDSILQKKELDPFEMPTDYEIKYFEGGLPYDNIPSVYIYHYNVDELSLYRDVYFVYIGNTITTGQYMVGVLLEEGEVIRVANSSNYDDGFEVAFDSVLSDTITPITEPGFSNCYLVRRSCYIYFALTIDNELNVDSVSAIVIG